jgi:hypothetical protein
MAEDLEWFHYAIGCGHPGCANAARFKIAAAWTNGTSRELKTYGLSCDAHRDSMVRAAIERRGRLRAAAEEEVGEIGLYLLGSGPQDAAPKRTDESDGTEDAGPNHA